MKISQIISLTILGLSSMYNVGANIVQDYVDQVINKRDFNSLDKFVTPNYVRRAALFPAVRMDSLSRDDRFRGIEQWRRALKSMLNTFPDLQVELQDMLQEGNLVYVTTICSGTQQRSKWGEASGVYFRTKCAVVHRLDEQTGKIASTEKFCDFAGIEQHFLPSPSYVTKDKQLAIDNVNGGLERVISRKVSKIINGATHNILLDYVTRIVIT